MSLDAVRAALAAKVISVLAAAYSTLQLEFENGQTKDVNDKTPYAGVKVAFLNSKQISVSPVRTRYWGELQIFILVKEGTGTKYPLDVAEALCRGLEFQRVGTAQLDAPRPLSGFPRGDWYCTPVMTSFTTDPI